MRRLVKIASFLLMVVWLSTMAVAAVQKPAAQQAGMTGQLIIGAQDVITASDAGGGALSTREIVIIIAVMVAVILLILIV